MSSVESGSSMLASISVTASVSFGCSVPKRACSATRWRSSLPRTRSMHSASLIWAWTSAPKIDFDQRQREVDAGRAAAAGQVRAVDFEQVGGEHGVVGDACRRRHTATTAARCARRPARRRRPATARRRRPRPRTAPRGSARSRRGCWPGLSAACASSATSSTRCQWRWASAANLSGLRTSTCRRSGPSSLAASRSGWYSPAQLSESGSPAWISRTRSGFSCARRERSASGIGLRVACHGLVGGSA